jgi:hypothetical protein
MKLISMSDNLSGALNTAPHLAAACKRGRLSVGTERRERRCAGTALVRNDRATEVSYLTEIKV